MTKSTDSVNPLAKDERKAFDDLRRGRHAGQRIKGECWGWQAAPAFELTAW